MKSKLLIICLLVLSLQGFSQEIRVNTYGGYVFKDQVDSYYSSSSFFDGQIQDGFRGGLGLEYKVNETGGLELSYLRQDTDSPTSYRDNGLFNGEIQFTDFDLVIDWIMLNGTRYFPINDQIETYASTGIGMGIFSLTNPDNNRNGSATKLAWNFRGGTNIWFTENVGIKLQAAFFSAVQSIGGGLYFGSGGTGGGLNTYSSMFQFSFDGGIVLRLPN